MIRLALAVLALSTLALSMGSATALAQDPAPAHVTVLPTEHIHGRIQRPTVFVQLSRARVRFDRAEPDRAHAVDRIVDSVAHDPF